MVAGPLSMTVVEAAFALPKVAEPLVTDQLPNRYSAFAGVAEMLVEAPFKTVREPVGVVLPLPLLVMVSVVFLSFSMAVTVLVA